MSEKRMQAIRERLIEARVTAGLSQTQAAKLLGLAGASSLSQHETGARGTEPKLSMFLQMCDIYCVSPTWVLTGMNPDFDERAFDKLVALSNVAENDIRKIKSILMMTSIGN